MINFDIINAWNQGFTGRLAITNSATTAIDGWTIEFEAPFEITNIWNAKILSQDGDRYVIQNESWNGNVAPDQTISFGFNGAGTAVEPTGYELNGEAIASSSEPTPVDPIDPGTDMSHGDDHTHGDDHQGGEHNHDEEPLPDDVNTDPLADGGQVFVSDGTTQRITNFDPTKDRVNIGTDSIHNQIPIDTPEGLVFQNMFNPSRSLTLVGIHLEDLSAENFTPIADAHLQQDLSAALAWENGTGYVQSNTVYIRSHEEGLEEVVDFNPNTDRISFFYLSVRGDDQLNFSVEQTEQGVRFYSPFTGQSMTLRGIEFSDLDSSHFEWRANQLEDNIAGRMGLSDKIANFGIVDGNVFSGKSVAMAGLVDRAPYHTNYPDYTGTRIDSSSDPMDPVDPVDPVDPIDPMDPVDPVDPIDPVDPMDPTDSGDPASTDSIVNFEITNDWGSGYQGQVNLTNNESSPLNGWTLEFEFSGQITQIWNAQIVSRNGNTYVISNASYNGTIAPGQEVSFGFLGDGSTATLPDVFKLNGELTDSPSAPIDPVDPVDPPTDPIDPVDPVDPMDPVDPVDPMDPVDPVDPMDPVDPVDPVDPMDPVDPVDPVDPMDPVDPVDPVDPPTDPTDPIDPVDAADPVNPNSPQTGDFNYGEALQKSLLFYEAQRSGPLPEESNRIEWRDDSAVNDGADVGVDLSGGYYDAGDHVKFGFPMAASMTMLSWGVVEYRDAYAESGQLDEVLDAIKWGTDYILNAHITDGQGTKEFWGQVGDGHVDHSYWGPAEEMRMNRPSFKIDRQNPGSDLAGESAAALASASIIFRESDPAYADRLLENAKQLFEFADQYRGKYSDSIPNASSFYNSWSGYMDELSWSAAWLHKATGDRTYLNKAEQYYQGLNPQWTHNWDNKSYGAATLLAQSTGKAEYQQDAEQWLNYWSNPNGGIQYTSGGLAWLDQWGSTRYTANTAFIAGVYSDTVNDYGDRYADFAEDQIDYLLGDNPNNFSYMVGFGDDYALNPHHRSAHGGYNINDADPNDNILYGALVGGPASPNDNDYADVRSDYIRNEVALDYNAGLTGALVRLYDEFGGNPLTDQQLDSLPGVAVSDI